MKTLFKIMILSLTIPTLSGCAGYVMNTEKNCSYEFLLHPSISISRLVDGCGPASKK